MAQEDRQASGQGRELSHERYFHEPGDTQTEETPGASEASAGTTDCLSNHEPSILAPAPASAYEADESEGDPQRPLQSTGDGVTKDDLDADKLYRFVRENHTKLKYGDTPPASDTSECPNTETRSYYVYVDDLMKERAQNFSSGSSDI